MPIIKEVPVELVARVAEHKAKVSLQASLDTANAVCRSTKATLDAKIASGATAEDCIPEWDAYKAALASYDTANAVEISKARPVEVAPVEDVLPE